MEQGCGKSGPAPLSYDSSGNTLSDGNNTYTWNGESQLISAGGINYKYDGDGRRVAKVADMLYWYGASGEVLSETDAAGNLQNEYIFFGGRRIAVVPASGSALYFAEDQLGSSRVIVYTGGTVCKDADFEPFGGEKDAINSCAPHYRFEGKERDTETGNDDFGARYYSWRLGRWLSSDWSAVPVPVPYANLTNPQTLNLYAMVSDDPETFSDLDGHTNPPGVGESDNACKDKPGCIDRKKAAQNTESSKKTGFWSRLGQHLGNLFSGHSWNYGMRESVTTRMVTGEIREPNPVATAVADSMGVAAAVTKNTPLGIASSVVSVANDRSKLNVALTVGSSVLPYVVEGSDVPMAFGFAAYDGSQFAGKVMTDVFTPDALQSDTISDGNGHLIPNPQASFDSGQAFGPN